MLDATVTEGKRGGRAYNHYFSLSGDETVKSFSTDGRVCLVSSPLFVPNTMDPHHGIHTHTHVTAVIPSLWLPADIGRPHLLLFCCLFLPISPLTNTICFPLSVVLSLSSFAETEKNQCISSHCLSLSPSVSVTPCETKIHTVMQPDTCVSRLSFFHHKCILSPSVILSHADHGKMKVK